MIPIIIKTPVVILTFLAWVIGIQLGHEYEGKWQFVALECGGVITDMRGFSGQIEFDNERLVEIRHTAKNQCKTEINYKYQTSEDGRVFAYYDSIVCSECVHEWEENGKDRTANCMTSAPSSRVYEVKVEGDILKRSYSTNGRQCSEAFSRDS